MSSITNQIVANIKRTSTNFNSHNFTNSENVVCIDTCFNRIGINRKNPEYSIDISGDINDISSAIRVNNLHIKRYAKIFEISTNKLETIDFSAINLDISYLTFNLISGETIDISYLKTNDISVNKLFIPDLSTQYLDVSYDINTNKLEVYSEISGHIIRAHELISESTLTFPGATVDNFNIRNLGTINLIHTNDLSTNYINAKEISSNNLYLENFLTLDGDLSCINLNVSNDTSLNKVNIQGNLNVEGSSSFTDISCTDVSCKIINCTELSGNKITIQTIESNGNTIINNGVLGDPNTPQDAFFKNLTATNLDISNVYITNYIDNSGITDLSNGTLILPEFKTEFNSQPTGTFKPGTLSFDNINNTLKVYNNLPTPKWNNILFKLNYANMTLRKAGETAVDEISGNTVLYEDTIRNRFYIHNDTSNNLRLSDDNTNKMYNVKYIPFVINNSLGDKFDISNKSKTIEVLGTRDTEQLFEIYATVGLRYLNRYSGDVEPNSYNFGIYPNTNDPTTSFDNSFVNINNTIFVFDNSFNYANSTLNYIGPLGTTTSQVNSRFGFDFYVSSNKDINFIAIDSFNATIKQLINF